MPDLTEVLPEAYKLVEEGLLDVIPFVDPDVLGGLVHAHAVASRGSDKREVTRRLPVSRSCTG